MPMNFLFGQSYQNLWKQVNDAQEKDLPQTEMKVLRRIVDKARREKAYGHLLKAELQMAQSQAKVAPDSLPIAIGQLRQEAEVTSDRCLQAVYYAVLGKVYNSNGSRLGDNWSSISEDYMHKAVLHPAELAAVKVDGYMPFVVKGDDSELFGNDLLSLIGYETRQYQPMYDYYMTTANRRAQLMSALYLLSSDKPDGIVRLQDCDYIRRLDSLANAYSDLPECGEVAISRYEFMNEETDATAGQKVAYIDEALNRWGSWHRMNELRNARRELTARQFHVTLQHRVWIPDRQQELLVHELRNIEQLSINIYKVHVDGDTELDPDNKDDYKKLKPLLTLLPEMTQKRFYSGKKDYEIFSEELQMGGLPVGVYMMEVESLPQSSVSRTLFFISNVRVLMEALPDNQLRYVTVNATTGQPVPGAQLRLTQGAGYRKNKVITTLTTDSKGEYIYHYDDNQRPQSAYVTTETDRACPALSAYGYFRFYDNDRTTKQTAIFTDRAIYRPGQTVHVAAICYERRNGFEHEAVGGKQVTVSLWDANRKVLEEKQLTTDETGTLSTEFTLPTSGLTGRYTVKVDNQSQSFRVEEYKRPTFQVEFPKVEQDYKAGDTVTVRATARTYAGVPVQGARVNYTIERRMAFWWMTYSRYWQGGYFGDGEQSLEIFSGEAMTGDDGTFEVQMPLVLPQSSHPMFYNFVVEAYVTDQAGETHHGELSLPLGNRKSALTADLAEKVLMEKTPSMKLHLLNMAGNDVNAEVRYQFDGGKWLKAKTNTDIELPRFKSGSHKLLAICGEDSLERNFVVFSLDDKRPATETDDWFYVSAQKFPNDGQPVTLQAGASGPLHVVYTLVAGNTIIEQGAADLKDELVNRKLYYKPEYGNGLTLNYAWVRDGKIYTHTAQIQRPVPDKTLTMKWETFRDRLTPGQQEEWTLVISAPDAQPSTFNPQPSTLNVIATLYDKSLDQIVAHNWSLEPSVYLPMANVNWIYAKWGQTGCYGYRHAGHLKVSELMLNHFDSDCFPYPWLSGRRYAMGTLRMSRSANMMKDASAPMAIPEKEIAVGAQSAKVFDAVEYASLDVDEEKALKGRIAGLTLKKETSDPEVQMRENLQETAFFYPQLTADKEGRVAIRFTLPESLTTWRFMGIAHTKDMRHGFIDGEAVAQKDVMIQPNVPRFLRMGDEGSISARIFNTTGLVQDGTARLQLLDPESGQAVFDEQQAVSIPAGSTANVSFAVSTVQLQPLNTQLLVCKMSVSSATFSDGEQHYLPILPNRERVTVTVPFTQTEPCTKTIDLTSIIPAGSSSAKLTVEYTNNPAWLMIQALPSIGHPIDKNAISQAASVYANSLGKFILDQNPQTKHVFELWKREATTTSLQSELEKNQELKDLLLNETPWVMDAEREAEQKQRLGDFFDENLLEQRLLSAVTQLAKLQCPDGSWSWWEGMPGSFYMTVEVSEMLVRLRQMTGRQTADASPLAALSSQLDQAFQFMDKEIVELVTEMKKQEKKGIKQTFPTFKALQYLYLCTLDGRNHSASVQQAHTYLKKLLKKDVKHQTIYEKALSALILQQPLYVQSLKEWTVYKDDMGRYYDTPRASYSWFDYRIPTQVAAIEAIQQLTPGDTQTIDEMRRWLLQEKRTQAWDTPINSINAIYAFLNGNSQELKPQAKTVLAIDGKAVETSDATAGIGYVKASQPYSGERLFTAEKTSAGTSWGAVYAQFIQLSSDVSDQQSGISVKREFLSAEANSSLSTADSSLFTPFPSEARLPVAFHSSLTVGQRIKVRLTIEADRDYDFVQIVDKRAACMEPVSQLSGYRWGYYCAPKDNATCYYFDLLPKGKRVIETEYYIDRAGRYETGTCTVQCAYAPEFRGTAKSQTIIVEPNE